MKATFLGHGLDSGNKNNVGKQLSVSLESKDYKAFNGFVAFASISGINMLKNKLEQAKSTYDQIRFYIGVDNRGTSKEALESLLHQNIETYIYRDKRNFVTYHPKLFLFEGPKFTRIIIGSSNLTSQGIKTNLEASIQLDFRTKTDKQGMKFLDEVKEYYAGLLDLSSNKLRLLTPELLTELINEDLLFTQFGTSEKLREPRDSDGVNVEELNIELTNFDIDEGFEQTHTTSDRDNKKSFSKNDYDKFEVLIERYISYKKTKRPSGIVSKHTEDRELFLWYQKMNALYNQGENSLPIEIYDRLIKVDFPFGGIGKERKRLNKWDKDFARIIEYKNKVDPNSDSAYVPQFKNKSNPYYRLGLWCAYQKQRRKENANYPPKWTQYEEDKMASINFIWDKPASGSLPNDDKWTDNLVELENHYNKKKNFKSVPTQNTYLGHWLSDQMSLKTKQDREGIEGLISPVRVELLGDLLAKNGVEWEWRKQKERGGIESKIESWRAIEQLTASGELKKFRENNRKLLKKYRDDVAQLRSQSKRWNNEQNQWKYELLDKVGFPYER